VAIPSTATRTWTFGRRSITCTASFCWLLRPRIPAKASRPFSKSASPNSRGSDSVSSRHRELREKAVKGGTRYLPKLREQKKLTARERLDLLLDAGSFVEDGLFANVLADELPADGVVTGLGMIEDRQVAVMANDPTVKAGSWGARTVEKIVRVQETAARLQVPLFYLVDSAGARITDQIEMFPGRRHAGRIFFNQVRLSGRVPQVCLLFGPSAAGGAYIPAFCDVVIMVEGNASMYLGSPRMVEVVVGEKVSLEELGGARMHATESGLGDALVGDDREAIEFAKAYFRYMPQRAGEKPRPCEAKAAHVPAKPIAELIPEEPNRGYDMRKLIDAIIDEGSWLEISGIVRKAYGAGLYAMAGPAFDTDAVIALPSAQIAVMGPEPAVNAVFYNKLAELPEDQRAAKRKELEDEYREDVDLYKLASNLIVDDVIEPEHLRETLIARFRAYATRVAHRADRKNGVFPV